MPPQGRVGDKANNPKDVHGNKCCPHNVTGPATEGSPDVLVNNRPALRVGDPGTHTACCGGNNWNAVMGSPTVKINFKMAHRKGDQTKHCGGMGKLIEGSDDVIVGGSAQGSAMQDASKAGNAFVQDCS